MQAFLAGGYEATSLSDLEAATGLHRRSLYNAFGDKEGLFLRALERFADAGGRLNLEPMEREGAGPAAIAGVLGRLADDAERGAWTTGCLICNTSCESLIERSPAVRRCVQAYFDRAHAAFASALSASLAHASGDAHDGDAESTLATVDRLAGFLTGVLVSVCVMDRAPIARSRIRHTVESALHHVAQTLDIDLAPNN